MKMKYIAITFKKKLSSTRSHVLKVKYDIIVWQTFKKTNIKISDSSVI